MDAPPPAGPARLLSTSLVLLVLTAISTAPAVAEERLGRLFFTPERRAMLDRQRQSNIQERSEAREDPMLTINGVVTRSSGKPTVWINGVAQNESNAPAAPGVVPNIKDPGRVVVKAGNARAAQAKVGDTVNRDTGEAADLLNGGRISIRTGNHQ